MAKAKKIVIERSLDIFGGPYYSCFETTKPRWFRNTYCSLVHFEKTKKLNKFEELSAGNLFIGREVLEASSGFACDIGPAGNRMAYGEESELQQRLWEIRPNLQGYYDLDLYVWHLVRFEKMNLRWRIRECFLRGRSYFQFDERNLRPATRRYLVLRAVQSGLHCLKDVLWAVIRRDRNRYPFIQTFLWEEVLPKHLHWMGRYYQQYLQQFQQGNGSSAEEG